MKLWLISELFYPEEVSTGYVMTKIAEKIAEKTEVNVICGPAEYESDVFKASYIISDSIKIHRVKIPNLNKNNLFLRVLRMFMLTFKMGIKILLYVKKDDKIILVTNPALLFFLVSFLKKIKGFKYIIIIHDVFPENLIPAGILKKHSFLYNTIAYVANAAYNLADQLIVVGSDMKNLVCCKVKKSMRIDVIQNWADAENIYPIIDFNANDYYNNDFSNKIILQFAGNIGRVQGLENFLRLFKEADNPELALVIIGEGALKSKLTAMIKTENLKNIFFYSAKSRVEQLYFLNACDIGLVTLIAGMYGLGVPSKAYNIMAAGKPILFIGDEGAEISLYIKEVDSGWAFAWEEKQKVIDFLSNLTRNDYERIKNKGKNARAMVDECFTKEIILSKYAKELVSFNLD